MTLSDISIKNPVFAWMMMAALIIFGLVCYSRLGVSQLPDTDFPVVSVQLTWEGAAPEVMETDVVDIVEDAVMSIQGIRDISSSIRQGGASISIEFDLERDIDVAVQDIQTKIDQAQRQLPKDLDPPIVTKVNPEDQPIVWMTVSSSTVPVRDLMTYVQNHIKDRFSSISGVGEIFLGGFVERNLRVWVDIDKLNALQLTVQDIVNAVQAQHQEIPAGRLETATKEFNIRVMGEALSAEEFGNIIIPQRAGQPVYRAIRIKDVATVEDSLNDIRRIARTNGRTTVGLGIRKQRGTNEVEVAHKVLKRLEEVKKTLPKDIIMEVRYNRTKFSEDSINELVFTLILSALITSVVCWIFLGSWSATLNILLAIPTSVLGSFIIIYFLRFTLNTFTVLGLSLAIGIVVDDAIMVLENIVRYREKGFDQVEAARRGAKQITFAAIAATLALVAIFLPVAFMSGIVGRFFFQFGVTISIAVLLSLLEALTLAPMRCSQFLEVGQRHTAFGKGVEEGFKRLAAKYHETLGAALKRPKMVVFVSLGLFFASLFLAGFLRKEFVPPQDMGFLFVRLQTPIGSSIPFTDDRFKQAERFVMSRPEVQGYMAIVGGFTGGEANSGAIIVTLKDRAKRPVVPPAKRPLSQQQLMTIFRTEINKVPDLRATIQDLSLSGFSAQRGFPIEFSVRGPDWEKLAQYSEEMLERLKKSSLMVDVDTDYNAKVPEVQVAPDRQRAYERGVDMQTIGTSIDALFGGTRIGKYTRDGRRYDVRIRLVDAQRDELKDFNKVWVWNNRGELVQLANVVSVSERPKPLTITRRNRERAISIFANVAPGKSQTDALAEVKKVAAAVLPADYHIVLSGSSQTFQESFANLLFALVMGILVAYMVLASQFNNYVHPLAVLFALPFSISGALISLIVANQSLNIYSFIGIILLMGIVKKNSILLVDFTNQVRDEGAGTREALLKACPVRLRPIIMTSASTVAAAIPPAMAIGPGAETRIPMAVTIIGGVIVSTALTLYVVPSIYLLMSPAKSKHYHVEFSDEAKGDTLV